MKKILQLSTIFAFLFTICLGLAGCDAKMVKINVDLDTIKTEYFVGEEQETYENAKVFVIYSDNNQKLIASDNEDLSFSSISTQSAGEKTLVVQYKKLKQEIKITVKQRLDKPISAIDIVEESVSKTSYHIDDEVDSYSNLKVKLSFADGTEDAIVFASEVPNLTITKPSTGLTGTSTLSVSCQEKTDSVNITITEKEIESISLAAEGAVFIKGQELPKENIYITVRYTDNSTRAITHNKDSFDVVTFNVDLTTSGYQDFSATYKNVTSNILENTPVFSSVYDTYYITFKNPTFMDEYYANSGKNNTSSKFKIDKKTYIVGDDNNFIFFPTILTYENLDEYLDPEAEGIKPSTYKLKFKVEERDNKDSNYKLLEGFSLSDKVSIDDEKGLLNFSDSAVGKQYRISVTPYFTTINGNDKKQAITFEFEVQDGYNVYKAEELCLFDNCNAKVFDSDANGVWTSFKTDKNYNFSVNGLFLHTKLTISDDENVLPKGYFHQNGAPTTPSASVSGSLVDYEYIYKRNITGENFLFNGNYFQIDVRNLPLVEFFGDDNSEKLSHSSLFYTLGNGNITFENIDIFGNGQRDNNELLAGGIILAKISTDSKAVFENVCTKALFTSYFSEYGATMTMNNCISSDNFSCILYSYGNNVNNVNNCNFSRCGGPIAIITHEDPEEEPYDRFGILNIDENSIMNNPVTFEEGWFAAVGASDLVTYFPLLDQLLNLSSGGLKNIRKDGYCNLVAVVLNGTDPKASSSKPVQGKVTYGNSSLDMLYNEENDYTKLIGTFNSLDVEQPPLFQAGGKTYYTDAQTGIYDTPASHKQITAASSPEFFNDKYIGLSLPTGGKEGRIGVLVEFFGELPAQEE